MLCICMCTLTSPVTVNSLNTMVGQINPHYSDHIKICNQEVGIVAMTSMISLVNKSLTVMLLDRR